MSEEWQTYVKDTRAVCKYGVKCYQKNPEHHATYKHPPQISKRERGHRNKRRCSPYSRNTNQPGTIHKKIEEKTSNKILDETNENPNRVADESKCPQNEEGLTETDKCSIKLPEILTYYDKNTDHNTFKELFLVEMPSDFFKFYECLNDGDNLLEETLASVNLELIGPYDLLLGKLPIIEDKDIYLIHWRFFYDPPEFQAVLKKKNKEFHIGYYRDDPKDKPVFLARNDSSKSCHITPMAENLFGAVLLYLQHEKKSSPFTAMVCQKLMEKIKKYAEEHNFSIEPFDMKKRLSKIVTRTFHGAGIVVPYNKTTQLGYRRLVETDANIKKILSKLEAAKSDNDKDKALSELQPIITYASIALDECDFGTGVELGIDLFCSGLKELESIVMSSLCPAYSLLNREPFSKIIKAHIKCRRRGQNMTLLSLNEK